MLKNNSSYLLLIQKYHSPLKMNKRWFVLETNISHHDLGTQIQVTLNVIFKCSNSFMLFS